MTNEQIKQRAKKRRIYFVLLLLLLAALIFAVARIIGQAHHTGSAEETTPADLIAEETDTTERPSDAVPIIHLGDYTKPAEESTTGEESETTEPEETTEEEDPGAFRPVYTSENGLLRTEKAHIYVRIGHSQKLEIQVASGVKKEDILWSSDNENIAFAEDGSVYGVQQGECTLSVIYEGDVLEIPVTVRELTVVDGCTYIDGILVANKTYSLPQSYDPGDLPITQSAFEKLAEAAAEEDLYIFVYSGYRSYDFQVTVYNSMVNGYSKEYADSVSARPGHSEHQTGYTIDCNIADNSFAETPAGKWLANHCYEYGFIIRYPEGKEDITGYEYESWHIRYVGKEHAKEIWEQGITLEEYLDITSSYADAEDMEEAAEEE